MSYGVRWVSPDGKTGHWTAPFATRKEAEEHAARWKMEKGLSYTVEEIGLSPIEAKPQPRKTMSYRVRFTTQTGATGYWQGTFATRAGATHSAQTRADVTGYTYTVEEVPEPGSTAAHHVEILRERVKELEALVATLRKNLGQAYRDNDDIHRELAFALDLGRAMREAMRTGEWRAGHDRSMASSAMAGWDRWKTSLAASLQGTAKASEAPREGGDSDRRRLEASRAFMAGIESAKLRAVRRELGEPEAKP